MKFTLARVWLAFCLVGVSFMACGPKGSGSESSGTSGTSTTAGGSTAGVGVLGGIGGGTTTTGGTSTTGANPPLQVQDLLPGKGTGGGSGTFTGAVDANTLVPTTAVYDVLGDQNNRPLAVFVALASNANFCTDFVQNGNLIAQSTLALFQVINANNVTGAPEELLQNQNYLITQDPNQNGEVASLTFLPLDANCNLALNPNDVVGESGTVALTSFDTTTAQGSFNAVVGVQKNTVSGKFKAAPCPGLAFELNAPAIGCQP